ncbi:MAG: PEP-CTERM sorting domain-containing protein [Candidatus Omnitrophica bacterium]|nr:PEP-CTERM sorting domain-containing protein [Candidatus Omnitrophota bacterium]
MKNSLSKIMKLVAMAGTLPFIYGCGSGGGSSLASTLFGPDSGISDTLSSLGSSIDLSSASSSLTQGATELATLHQPEPASMLLLGSGLIAAMYFSRRKK